jgi:hypothetical protein
MKKNSFCLLLTIVFVLCGVLSVDSFASDHPLFAAEQTGCFTYYYEDGSTLTISTAESLLRGNASYGTKHGTRTYTKTNSNNITVWSATLDAYFEYTGTSALCTSASCPISIYDSSYSVSSKTVTRNGNQASCTFTIVQKILGITVGSETHTITLSCDPFGNLY